MTHRDIIALWPSVAQLARDLNLPYHRVSKWWQRGEIHPYYWLSILEISIENPDVRAGLMVEDFLDMYPGTPEDL